MDEALKMEDPNIDDGIEPYKDKLGSKITMTWGEKIDVTADRSIDVLFKIVNNIEVKSKFVSIQDSDGIWHQLNINSIGDVIFYKIY